MTNFRCMNCNNIIDIDDEKFNQIRMLIDGLNRYLKNINVDKHYHLMPVMVFDQTLKCCDNPYFTQVRVK